MDLQGLLKDRKFQIAAGGGVLLGGVVLLRKKSSGGGGETSSTTGTAGALGTYNDQGMDAYNNLNNELNAGIQAYGDQLTSLQDQLNKLKPAPSTTGGGTGVHPKPPAPKNTAKNYGWFVSRNNRNTPAGIARKYGISTTELYRLNPSLKGKKTVRIGTRVQVRAKPGPYKK